MIPEMSQTSSVMSTLIKLDRDTRVRGRDYYLGPAGKSEESQPGPESPFDGSLWYHSQPFHQASYLRDNQMSSPTSLSSSPSFLMTVRHTQDLIRLNFNISKISLFP